MLDVCKKLSALLSRRERLELGLLAVAVLVMAFLEMTSVAALLPFLSVAADPTKVHSNAWLAWAYDVFGFTSANRFLLALGSAALVAFLLSNTCMAATVWAQAHFSYRRMHTIGARLLRHYAAQPYVFFLSRNSADLGKNVLSEVEQVTGRILNAGLQVVARSVVALAIVGLLVLLDPLLALLIAILLGVAYTAIFLAVRRKLARIGLERIADNRQRYQAVSELFGAIKDIKLLGKEHELLRAFEAPSARFARHQATASVVGQLPRYVLETVAFGGVLLIAIYLLARGGSLQHVVPVLGLYAFAGYRLMPSLQQAFQGLTLLRFGAPALDNLYRELTSTPLSHQEPARPRGGNGTAPEALPLCRRLELERITFTYPGAFRPALDDVSLSLDANAIVGFMGPTGSGKTTLVDVMLGLLRPQAGEIRVDGVPLMPANLRAWQNGIGYVPQHIYLADDTIARNIAFGVPPHRIDMAAVERAARLAQIHDFIANDLAMAYATPVGERGVRLSGGQRQRVGIARALYHEPTLLVLDEATSALDHRTEDAVMEAIRNLAGSRTIVLVTHRLTTLRVCDRVYTLEGGQLRASAQVAVFPDGATAALAVAVRRS
jgi:ATP-binding cassette, subfamily B, bacterial PglK